MTNNEGNWFYCFQRKFLDHIRDTNTASTETGSSGSLFVVWNVRLFTRMVQFIKLWHDFKEGCDISKEIPYISHSLSVLWSNIKVILHLELTKASLKTQYQKYSVSDALQNTLQTTFVLLIKMNVQCIHPNTESYPKYIILKSWSRANLLAGAHFHAGFRQRTKGISFLPAPLDSKSCQLSPFVSHTAVSKLPASAASLT